MTKRKMVSLLRAALDALIANGWDAIEGEVDPVLARSNMSAAKCVADVMYEIETRRVAELVARQHREAERRKAAERATA